MLLIHGAHGASYSYFSVMMERKYPKPSKSMWDDLTTVCAGASAVDYALFRLGLGLGLGLGSGLGLASAVDYTLFR